MINTIIEAIHVALAAEFGSGYMIYKEDAKQDLQRPCFFISCTASSRGPFLKDRDFWTNQFCIQYFPETDHANETCSIFAERLFLCLKHLEIYGIPVRGIKMKYEAADGIMNFFVNYDVFVCNETNTEPKMTELTGDILVKG